MPVPRLLSASVLGRPIAIAAAVPTLVHTSVVGQFQRVRLVASNASAAPVVLTLVVAGAAALQQLEHTIAADTTVELPDIPVANGQSITAFGGAQDNEIRITGAVTPY